MGSFDWGQSFYIRQLNQDRFIKKMTPDPNGQRVVHDKTPAKWAIVQVLSKRLILDLKEIEELLLEMNYRRKRSSLRRALRRIVRFGFAVRHTRYRPKRAGWQLTERGRQLPLIPPKRKNDMGIQSRIEDTLATKTSWVYVADLAEELQLDKKSVGGALRKLFAKDKTIRKVTVGVGPRLWALKSVYDSNQSLTIPPPPAKKQATKKTSPRKRATIMCLPNKPTLVTAVTTVVNELMAAKKKFSAHDVTKEVRERASKSTITLDVNESGNVFHNGASVPRVQHDDVKEVVAHLFSTGEMSGYARLFNGTYMEYAEAVATANDPSNNQASQDPVVPAVVDGGSYDGSSTI